MLLEASLDAQSGSNLSYSTKFSLYLLKVLSHDTLAGWLHLKLIEKANEGNQAANENLDKRDIKSGVSAAIERLESNLHK